MSLHSFNPFDLIPSDCFNNNKNEAANDVGNCLKGPLDTVLGFLKPVLQGGIPSPDGGPAVSVDPLRLPDVQDPNPQPRWKMSGIQLNGLLGLTIDSLRMTDKTVSLQVSFPSISGEAAIKMPLTQFQPQVKVTAKRPRMALTAGYQFVNGKFALTEPTPTFLNDGLSFTVKNTSELATWNPVWDENE